MTGPDPLRLDLLPPPIVEAEPRYRQQTSAGHPTGAWDLDGLGWTDVPAPPRRHEHWAQTVVNYDLIRVGLRCPCSASRFLYDPRERGWFYPGPERRFAGEPPVATLTDHGLDAIPGKAPNLGVPPPEASPPDPVAAAEGVFAAMWARVARFRAWVRENGGGL